jgi:hypothetical protein
MESEEDEYLPAFHFTKHHPNLPRIKTTRLDWPTNPRKNIFKTEKYTTKTTNNAIIAYIQGQVATISVSA